MNANEKQTINLAAGQVLTVTAPPGATGSVVRLSRVPGGGNSQSTTEIAGANLTFGAYADVERFEITCTAGSVTYAMATPEPSLVATDVEADAKIAAAEALTISKTIYVNKNRTDSYTADGTIFRPYKTVLAALTVINADTGKDWIIKIDRGTYADNLTITNPRSIRFEGMGVVLSGTILINSAVGSYDRIEFVGVRGHRAEKGPAMTISGAMTATRTNDSLIYVGFHGCLVSGAFEATTAGTWVLQYTNCRVNGAITGTFATNTQLDSSILIETYGFNEFAGVISGIVSFYNCNGSDIYGAINTTPWFENRFTHTSFAAAVTIAPQGGAASTLVYVDEVSYKSLAARTPTFTGATYSFLGLTIPVPVDKGGTGKITLTAGSYMKGAGTSAMVERTPGEVLTDLGLKVPSYGGMYAYGKAIPFNITVAATYHALCLITAADIIAGSLSGWTFNAGRIVDSDIASEADGTGHKLRVVCQAAHGLTNGDLVVLGKMQNAGHNKSTRITIDGTNPTTEFLCDDITYVAGAGNSSGTVTEPAYLKAGADAGGVYFASFTIDGTAAAASKQWKWELNTGLLPNDNIVSERLSTNTLTSMTSSGHITIAVGDKVWLSAKNSDDTTDYSVKNMNINLHRLG